MADIMNNFVDLHNHSLPGVDDGAQTMEEALENIKYLKELGFKKIVLTSHYIENTRYTADVLYRKKVLDNLKEQIKDWDIELYLGNEVYLSDEETISELLANNDITTLNGSKYILIEFPMHQRITYVDQIICALNAKGLIPIIAHPERYSYYWDHFDKLKELLEYKCYFQSNLESIVGRYGSNAKKQIKRLLKEDMVMVLATDLHNASHHPKKNDVLKKIEKEIGKEKLKMLLDINPNLILRNEEID